MNNSDMSPEKRRKLAELDRMNLDRQARAEVSKAKLDRDRSDPRVQRGAEIVFLDQVDEVLEPGADSIADSIMRLAEKLTKLGLLGKEEPWTADYVADILGDGEHVPGVHTSTGTYSEHGSTQLLESRKAKGRVQFRRLDEHGPVEDWRDAPPSNAKDN